MSNNFNPVNYTKGGESSSFLSKMKTYGSSISMTTILIIAASILFIIGGIYYYSTYVSSKMNTTYTANNESDTNKNNGPTKEAEMLFFYADWCPHCKTAKPIWYEVADEYENKNINGYKVIFTEINCTNETDEVEKMMNQYKVEGFPTIKMIKDGQVIEYDAKPTRETLVEFLNTVL
jgi:thiol-disulfide isomerase/thioredoxin